MAKKKKTAKKKSAAKKKSSIRVKKTKTPLKVSTRLAKKSKKGRTSVKKPIRTRAVKKKKRGAFSRGLFKKGKRGKLGRAFISKASRSRPHRSRELVLILDFGSQYTQLIARRIRENKVFSKIVPYNITPAEIQEMNPKGIIFSGGPMSVYDKNAPMPNKEIFKLGKPILGICYGMQAITVMMGGSVERSKQREFGRAELFVDSNKDLFMNLPTNLTCWMSHADAIKKLPAGFIKIAHTLNAPVSAFANRAKKIFGVQFHPEVVHTQRGNQVLLNFVFQVCGCLPRWTMDKFINASIKQIKETVGNGKVVLGLSGGVDSSVAAMLLQKAIGKRLYCIFVDNGLLRKNESATVQRTFKGHFKMNLNCVNAEKRFLQRLKNVTDPEQKRKIIGDEFVRVFQESAKRIKKVEFLGQGTLYPDVIESFSPIGGPSATIKSHHNVGGLPKSMKLKLVEPLRELFKDEVRTIGKILGLPDSVLKRQPFPGPGLAVRIVGAVTPERLMMLQEADERVLEEIKKAGLYDQIWQSFAVLLPIKSVGVMGDQRTYENAIAIRAVESVDGMTADWSPLPHEVMAKISNRIINEVDGINRVVYDISSKPPATIEWE